MNRDLWRIALSLLLRRRRALLILLAGITVSVSLVCTLIISAMSLMMTMTEQWNQMLGAQAAVLTLVGKEELLRAIERHNPAGLARIDLAGAVLAADRQQIDDQAIVIGSIDKTAVQTIRVLPEEGRMPAASGEIALERNALLRLNRQGRLGDVLSLPVRAVTADGLAQQVQSKTFTVVGILPNRSRLRNGHLGGLSGPGWPNAYVSQADAAEAAVCHVIISDPTVFDLEKDSPVQRVISELLANNDRAALFVNQSGQAFSIIDRLGGLLPQSDGGYASEGTPAAIWLIVPLVLILMLACGIAGAFAADLRGRRRQLALLRAIGATRRQVILMTVEQAMLVFLPAAPAGVLLSYALTGGMLRIIGQSLGMTVVIWRSWPVMLVALALSLLVSLASALAPAVRLSRLAPVQAVTRQQTGGRQRLVARRLPAFTRKIAWRLTRRQLKSHLSSLLAGAIVMGLSMAACTAVWTFSIAYPKNNWLPESDYWLSDDAARYPPDVVAGLPVTGLREPGLEKADFAEMAALPGIGQCQVVAYLWHPLLLLDSAKDSPYVRQMVEYARREQGGRKGQSDLSAHDLLQINRETLIATIEIKALDDASLQKLISTADIAGSADLEAMQRGEAVLACLPPTVYQLMTQTQGDQTWQTLYYGCDPEKGDPVANTTLAPGDLLHFCKLYAPVGISSGSLTAADVTLKELKAELTGLLDLADAQRQIKVSRPTIILHLDALAAWGVVPEQQTVSLMVTPEADAIWLEQELELRYGDKAHVVSRREQAESNRQFALLVSIIGFSILGFLLLLTTLAALNQNAVRRQLRRRDNAILRALGLQASTLGSIQLADGLLQVVLATLIGVIGTGLIWQHLFTPQLMGSAFDEPIPWALLMAIAGTLCLVMGLDTLLGIRSQRKEGIIGQIRQLD